MKPFVLARLSLLPVFALLTLAACRPEPPADAEGDHPPGDWTVTPRGIGPLRAGMSVGEAAAIIGEPGLTVDTASAPCRHVPLIGAPGRVLAMVVDDRVVRIEVTDSLVPTDRGARVGDSEERIAALYAGLAHSEPHKYTDGRYLVITPPAPADSAFRLIFETGDGQVTRYRAGLLPQVAWVEGCS